MFIRHAFWLLTLKLFRLLLTLYIVHTFSIALSVLSKTPGILCGRHGICCIEASQSVYSRQIR